MLDWLDSSEAREEELTAGALSPKRDDDDLDDDDEDDGLDDDEDLDEDDEFDEAQMATWVKQAAALPGWDPGRRS